VQYDLITTKQGLADFCQRAASAKSIAFDTEFVSEDTYRPDLCLIQVATEDELVIIDPKKIGDVTSFWELLATPGHETLVHAGREELRFCIEAVQKHPVELFDMQIAAGLVGMEYPASLKTLLYKRLDKSLPKGETRSDWRRRPLTQRQLEYAILDVAYLLPLRDLFRDQLAKLGRLEWMQEEMTAWQASVVRTDTRDPWRRVSGMNGLSRRSLAIVRELWQWRDSEARSCNRPPRRILRDDLLIEIARRKSSNIKHLQAVRGMQRHDLQRHLEKLAQCVEQALALSEEECPSSPPRNTSQKLTVLSQFIGSLVGSVCRSAQLAPSLAYTMQDIRDLIASNLNTNRRPDTPTPALAKGWRAEIVGRLVDDLLQGKLAVRIHDPLASEPLSIEPVS